MLLRAAAPGKWTLRFAEATEASPPTNQIFAKIVRSCQSVPRYRASFRGVLEHFKGFQGHFRGFKLAAEDLRGFQKRFNGL